MSALRVTAILACIVAILPVVARAQTPDAPAPPTPDHAALERELQQILAEPDFRRAMRASGDSRDFVRWVRDQLGRLFGRLGGLHETNYAVFLVSVIVGGAVLLGLLTHITYTLVRALRRPSRGPAPPDGAPRARPQTVADLRREAEALAEAGRFRDAVRALYLALLRSLQATRLLPRTSSFTNAELLRLLREHGALITVVRPFTETFDSRWYGGRPATRDDFARCCAWFEAAQQEVEGR